MIPWNERPPVPAPMYCATCGLEADWVWDDDVPTPGNPSHVPEPSWEIDGEWWGSREVYHCSRRCYITGDQYLAKRKETA